MSETSITCISEKISKIRCIPEQYDDSNSFISGSWDLNVNNVKLWQLSGNDYGEGHVDFMAKCTAELGFPGDISGLEFINSDNFAISSSDGFVSLIHINRNKDEDNLEETFRFKNLHTFSNLNDAPCTGISVHEEDIASVGEDGNVHILSSSAQKVIKSFKNVDSCTITCVSFINQKEILVGNRLGVLKIFDARTSDNKPVSTSKVLCKDDKKNDSNSVTCIAHHPTQKHIVLGGSEQGTITIWDLRQPEYAASYLDDKCLQYAVTEIAFHPTQPSRLFTASEEGDLYQWSYNTAFPGIVLPKANQNLDVDTNNPWLNAERSKNEISVTSLLGDVRKPINSFDYCSNKVICGGDTKAIYTIKIN